jgi:hypothetical protein
MWSFIRITACPPQRAPFADPPGCNRKAARASTQGSLLRQSALLRFLSGGVIAFGLLASGGPAQAQDGILGRGDAVVTGFSGIRPGDAPIPPGANPLDEFFIDVDGASAQIQSLAAFGQPPQGQLAAAPSKLQIKARQVGQVFAIGLDDGRGEPVPNIYLGATSAYGLQIVLPDSDGDGAPERVKKGHPNAQWMAGQFGLDAGGGPGSIWRVDGKTGAVSLFTTLPGNSGPGVGDVVFDKPSRQFFASDLDSGHIHRIGETGMVFDSFDHGAAGRPKKGLAAVNDDGSQLDIKSPAFDTLDPGTWGFTAEERRVHGMAIQGGRLYYAVARQVWSVGISQTGFSGDARWEFDADALPGDGPITDMLFDKQGRIYLAQRGAQRASYDYSVFAEAEKSNVVRYRREEPDNPATESIWAPDPEAYAIGMPPEHHHAEGGVALGYAHDANGALRGGACGEMLWSTGHRLRPGTDDAEAAEADVHGLQGNDISLVRPQNTPPQQSYFTDYDSLFGDAAKSGHVGDVEIWQPCEGAPDFAGFAAPSFGQLPPGILPPGDVPPDLPPEFPPEYEFETNLKLTKRAKPKTCSPFFGGWLCQYTVRVTNTGPDNYFGPILVRDWLPAAPAGAVMGFAPTPPWNCWSVGASDHRCVRFGTFLAPGWSVDLTAYAWVPKSYDKCHLTNAARVEWAPPGSQWNSNPFDDMDFAVATIPADHCKPGDRSDLTIYKVAVGNCYPSGGKLRCPYLVGVQNLGPAPYNGVIQVEDTVPAGTTAVFAGAPWAPAGPVGSTYTLTHLGANLAPGAFAPLFAVGVDVPLGQAKQMNCKVENEVKITQAPGGSAQNFNPLNDTASAVATIPAKYCDDDPRRSNLKIEKTEPLGDGVACKAGVDWCRGFKITVTNTGPNTFNGKIKVTDIVPAGASIFEVGGSGWTCMGAACETDDAVTLDKNPPSADKVSFGITLQGTAEDARRMNCKLTNKARIDSPLGAPKNIIAADDKDQITVDLPAKFCKQQTNLKLEKAVDANGCLKGVGGVHHCYYNVTVTNTGPGDYNDKIVVEENIPPGMTAVFAGMGWSCVPAGPDYTCTWNNPPLNAGEKTVLGVQINVPDHLAKEFQCKIKNIAKISHALGGSNQNTNPNDDEGTAIADVPEICDRPVRTNLKIEKVASPKLCEQDGDGWWCNYAIRVINLGPGDYDGPLEVEEALPAEPLDAQWNAPWSCEGTGGAGAVCKHPNTTIAANATKILTLKVKFSNDVVKEKNCMLANVAKIKRPAPGSPKNTNPGDDIAGDSALVPEKFCEREPTNLRLIKQSAQPQCSGTADGGYRCPFEVIVRNVGNGKYDGPITVRDYMLDAPGLTMQVPDPWECVGAAPSIICKHPAVQLDPGEQVVMPVEVTVRPRVYQQCSLTNAAVILQAPGGSVQNQIVGDDKDSATMQFQPFNVPGEGSYCRGPTSSQDCPPGYLWNGERCDRPDPVCKRGETRIPGTNRCCPPGEPWNPRLRQCGGDIPPPPPPPPGCEPGWTPIPGTTRCCPPGRPWTGQQCGRDVPPPECPEGYRGTPPNCWKPDAPQCNRTARCLGGMTWSMEQCACVCPRGQVMKRGRCMADQPECPPGTTGTPPNCVRPDCPPGTTGRPPRCKPVVKDCPKGTVGTPPNCRKVEQPDCPPGTTGRFPRCKPIVKDCPQGMVGTPPNCRRVVVDPPRQCPPGMVGRFPNCRPVVRVCPPGMVGQPPNCRRIGGNPQGSGPARPPFRFQGGGNLGPRPQLR